MKVRSTLLLAIVAVIAWALPSTPALGQSDAPRDRSYPADTSLNATTLPGMTRELTMAQIDAQMAWARVVELRQAYQGRIAEQRRAAESSPELKNALRDAQEVQQAIEVARQQAIAKVAGNPDYQSLLSSRRDAQVRLEQFHARGQEGLAYGMAEAKLRINTDLARIEREAFNSTPQHQDARNRLVAANERIRAIRLKDEREIGQDDASADLRKQIDRAEWELALANRRLLAAQNAYGVALANRDYFAGLYARFGGFWW